MKKILIIGGGFAGSKIAKKLEKYKNFETILVDTKDYFEFTPSIIKLISNPSYYKKIQIFHKDYLKKTKIITGEVIELMRNKAIIHNGNKLIVDFDYCVICSGAKHNYKFKSKKIFFKHNLENALNLNELIINSKKITIIGGGLVGVEIAGEIADYFKDKEITLIHSKNELIERMNKKSRDYARKKLEIKGVKILFNETVKTVKENYILTDKNKIKSDLTILCTGISPQIKFFEKNFKNKFNEKNYIKVNEFLQVEGENYIFSAGDVNNIDEEKTAQNAEKQAKIVIRNILNLEKEKPLKKYKIKKRTMIVSLGKYDGIGILKKQSFHGPINNLLKTIIEKKVILLKKM